MGGMDKLLSASGGCLSVDGESTDKLPLSVAPLGSQPPCLVLKMLFKKPKCYEISNMFG